MSNPFIKPEYICFLLILNLYTAVSFSQFFLTPDELYEEGTEFIIAEEFEEALPYFLQLLEKGYHNASIHYQTGQCYLFIPGQKEKSIQYLETAVKKASHNFTGRSPDEDRAPLDALYLLGMAYRINNQLGKSEKIFASLTDSLKNDTSEMFKVKEQLKICRNANELIRNEISLQSVKLEDRINTIFSNYNPVVNNDESLIFYMDALKFYDAVMQSEKSGERWKKPDNITPKIKSDGDYIITDITEDGNILLLRLNDAYTKGDIYMCEKKNGKWDVIRKLNANINTRFNETHASFANKGKTLYFTSNRTGGYGGLDIYRSDLDSGGDWGSASNLGPVINTSLDEESPFMCENNQSLFFSSQGHYNMGGFDIFVSTVTDGELQNPLNIGFPLNTTDNDLFYFPLKDGKQGYHAKFTDNLDGNLDIYRYEIFSVPNPARFTIKGQISLPPRSTIPFEEINITLTDRSSGDTISSGKAKKDGRYHYTLPSGEYELYFSTDQAFLDRKSISLPQYLNIEELIVNPVLEYKPAASIDTFVTKETTLPEKPGYAQVSDTFIIQHVLFGFDRYIVSKAQLCYLDELAQLLQKYPDITVSIDGHTDAIGRESYNKVLSVKRASEVAGYLISLNISKSRISIKGHGEEMPVAINRNKDGSDNPEGRRYNRRAEISLDQIPDDLFIMRQVDIPDQLRVK
ncbi:MAG: OmpA family protein [Bacteroidales bacterium]|nr:OmpA family protein [Bacteroidales bacterium]